MRKLALALGLAALVCQPLQAQTAEFHQIGVLMPDYVTNLACAEEVDYPHSAFLDFKALIARNFGDELAARVQATYDKARAEMNNILPSKRAALARDLGCAPKADMLAHKIEVLWQDGVWKLSR